MALGEGVYAIPITITAGADFAWSWFLSETPGGPPIELAPITSIAIRASRIGLPAQRIEWTLANGMFAKIGTEMIVHVPGGSEDSPEDALVTQHMTPGRWNFELRIGMGGAPEIILARGVFTVKLEA